MNNKSSAVSDSPKAEISHEKTLDRIAAARQRYRTVLERKSALQKKMKEAEENYLTKKMKEAEENYLTKKMKEAEENYLTTLQHLTLSNDGENSNQNKPSAYSMHSSGQEEVGQDCQTISLIEETVDKIKLMNPNDEGRGSPFIACNISGITEDQSEHTPGSPEVRATVANLNIPSSLGVLASDYAATESDDRDGAAIESSSTDPSMPVLEIADGRNVDNYDNGDISFEDFFNESSEAAHSDSFVSDQVPLLKALSAYKSGDDLFDDTVMELAILGLFPLLAKRSDFRQVLSVMKKMCGSVSQDQYLRYMNSYVYRGGDQPSIAAFNSTVPPSLVWTGGDTLPFSCFKKGMLRVKSQPKAVMRSIHLDSLMAFIAMGLEKHCCLTYDVFKLHLTSTTVDLINLRSSLIKWEEERKKVMVEVSELQPVKVLFLQHLCSVFDISNRKVVPVNNRPELTFTGTLKNGTEVTLTGHSDLMIFPKNVMHAECHAATGTNELKRPIVGALGAGSGRGNHRDQSLCQSEAVQRSKGKTTISVHVTDDMFVGYLTISVWRGRQCHHITCPRTTDARALVLFNLLLLYPLSLDALDIDKLFVPASSKNTVAVHESEAAAPAAAPPAAAPPAAGTTSMGRHVTARESNAGGGVNDNAEGTAVSGSASVSMQKPEEQPKSALKQISGNTLRVQRNVVFSDALALSAQENLCVPRKRSRKLPLQGAVLDRVIHSVEIPATV